MAFQDFDQISERRKLERQQKMKRRIMIAVVLLLLILAAVAAAVVYLVVFKNKSEDASANKSNKNASKEPTTPKSDATPPPKDDTPSTPPAPPPKEEGAAAPLVEDAAAPSPPSDNAPAPSPQEGDNAAAPALSPQAEGAIGAICAATEFNQTCGDILSKVLQTNASGAQPADLLKATMSAAIDEIAKGIDELGKINKDSPEKSTAYDDCMSLLADAKKDLNSSIYILDGGINDVASATAELNNKLSAALTYQDMCVDGYPEADQSTVQTALKKIGEHTINSLAVASELSTTSPKTNNNAKRRLLTTRLGVPTWMNQGDRRMLEEEEGKDPKGIANATVAKDGSGDFTTINDALKAVPSFEGRYNPFPNSNSGSIKTR